MTENAPPKQTWFITGAGRGMGVDFAKAALAAGHNVVATGRTPDAVAAALGESEDLLVVKLTVNLFGPMNVTRAVLPVMRMQRSGHVVTISSTAGFACYEGGTAYATSKFAVDGWMESLAPEIAPFGIHTTIVNPGFFRTELLTDESTSYARESIEDYA